MIVEKANIPSIKIVSSENLENNFFMKEVFFGIEEEGVPYEVKELKDHAADAVELAFLGAQESMVGVGIGINSDGLLAVHYQKLSKEAPLFFVNCKIEPSFARIMASNAARLVKGIPFILPENFSS